MATCGLATPQVSGKRGSHGHLAEVGAMWDCPVGTEATGWTAVGKSERQGRGKMEKEGEYESCHSPFGHLPVYLSPQSWVLTTKLGVSIPITGHFWN